MIPQTRDSVSNKVVYDAKTNSNELCEKHMSNVLYSFCKLYKFEQLSNTHYEYIHYPLISNANIRMTSASRLRGHNIWGVNSLKIN